MGPVEDFSITWLIRKRPSLETAYWGLNVPSAIRVSNNATGFPASKAEPVVLPESGRLLQRPGSVSV